ncbi:MAG TPA: hypothetical protein VGM00_10745 [Bradyrhizobium sp.]
MTAVAGQRIKMVTWFTSETQIQIHRFRYEGMAFHALGSGEIIFTLRREEGPFGVALTVEDAKRLLADLPEQIRIATGQNA